eukprot:scaffold95659_cov72-Phaeocystis_antarctica.AAC.2
MASAWLRQSSAARARPTFPAGASDSAAARSKCAAAFMSSAAERGPASQARHIPLSTKARMWFAA